MRDIKFRQWNPRNRAFQYDIGVVGPGSWCGPAYCTWEVFTLEQFTGLHDKNGKEIYEGDIVLSCVRTMGIRVVGWHDTEWCLFKNKTPMSMARVFWEKSEVIGNIHESPEFIYG